MNKIKHHLTEQLLIGYAAGTLPEAFNLVVAAHVSMCDACRAAVAAHEAVGGEVLLDAGTSEMSANALDAAMMLIDQGIGAEPAPAPRKRHDVFPAPVMEYLGDDPDRLKWRKIGGGVSQLVLKTSDEASVRLLRIPAGTKVPDHSHGGTEVTLVLQGAFVDETDRFAAGDVEVANEHMHHTPVAEEGQDCICLSAIDAPLKFSGLLPRIVQRFARI